MIKTNTANHNLTISYYLKELGKVDLGDHRPKFLLIAEQWHECQELSREDERFLEILYQDFT